MSEDRRSRSGKKADRGPTRAPTRFIRIGVVLVVAGSVAVVSQNTSVWTPLRDGHADRPEIVAAIVVLCILGAIAALAVIVLVHRLIIARRPGARSLGRTLLRATPMVTAALAVLSLLVIEKSSLDQETGTDEEPVRTVDLPGRAADFLQITDWWAFSVMADRQDEDEDESAEAGAAPDPGAPLPALLIMIGLAALLLSVAALSWFRSRSGRRPSEDGDVRPAEDTPREAVHGAVVESIDGMLDDLDPNTAIIGAYARLLEGLAACGSGRRDHEAPMEHLHRVLTIVQVRPEPLRQLVQLFEIARFSTHPLTSAHRTRALDALRAVAGDIASASTSGLSGSSVLSASSRSSRAAGSARSAGAGRRGVRR